MLRPNPVLPALFLAAALLAGLLVGTQAPRPELALAIRDLSAGGRLQRYVPLGPAGDFDLVFTHSMYGGAVTERYTAVAGPPIRLRRSTIRAERGGAAEYYALYGNMRQEGVEWIVDSPPLELPALPVRVDHVGRPLLRVGQRVIHLLDVVPAGHVAELRPAVIALRERPA